MNKNDGLEFCSQPSEDENLLKKGKKFKSTCSRLATPKAPFLSVISRHTNCCRVQSWQKHSQVLLSSAELHKEETFLQQTWQGEHS